MQPVIIDINPRFGSIFGGQRVWIVVQNLRRAATQHYLINFGDAGNVSARFFSPVGDTMQMLECETPVNAPGDVYPSLRSRADPNTPLGVSTTPFVFIPL